MLNGGFKVMICSHLLDETTRQTCERDGENLIDIRREYASTLGQRVRI